MLSGGRGCEIGVREVGGIRVKGVGGLDSGELGSVTESYAQIGGKICSYCSLKIVLS